MSKNWISKDYKAIEIAKEIKEGIIKVPQYQRGQVWKESQKEKLMDSIKSGYPFGSILLYKKTDNDYQLIDGLQRVSTIYEYIYYPGKYFKQYKISSQILEGIYDVLNVTGNKELIKQNLNKYIHDWVIKSSKTLEDVKNLSDIECAEYLTKEHFSCNSDTILEIAKVLKKEFNIFRSECEELIDIEIPAIVYEGDPDNLPEVFNRINSRGTPLSKYQILSATWTLYEYKIIKPELSEIIPYVDSFYKNIINNNFSIEGYDIQNIHDTRKLNFFQILFGFGKLISHHYPYLFSPSKKDEDIESCGFNLVNACVGNKNSKLANLPKIIQTLFPSDDEFNKFLINIISSIENVYKSFKPYLEFKLNKRNDSKSIYHSEFQICSVIANYFNCRYATYVYDDKTNEIVGRSIKLEDSNKDYTTYRKEFKENAFKKYLIDILNDNWRGSGDHNLNIVALDKNYYTEVITSEKMNNELDHWFDEINSRKEYRKVANPKSADKLLLSVIYSHSFSAFEQNDDITYDIEHLVPKGKLKMLIKNITTGEQQNGLPISSFANICLLREEVNRKKKDKTLYEDDNYLKKLKEKDISINEIEARFSFTTKKDLEWTNREYLDFSDLKKEYFSFLNNRFSIIKDKIIGNLFFNQKKYDFYNAKKSNDFINNLNVEESTLIYISNKNNSYQDLNSFEKEIWDIIRNIPGCEFELSDIYNYKERLQKLYPNNKHIESKIRQNLQKLRDKSYIEFMSSGKYKRLK
ncbi:MAG: DUF262 domain-containing protein [Massilimicrobiota sp.]|nr:DUF262 domain-containing protein [Massilimicrobiota sp.]